MVRDFTEEQKQRLLEMVKEVHPDSVFDLLEDWLDDMFHILTGGYRINDYLRDMSTYHRKMIDMENISARRIQKIFDDVYQVDDNYRSYFSSKNDEFDNLRILVNRFSEGIGSGVLSLNSQDFLKFFSNLSSDTSLYSERILLTNAESVKDSRAKSKSKVSDMFSIIDNGSDFFLSAGYPIANYLFRSKFKVPTFQTLSEYPNSILISESPFYNMGTSPARVMNLDLILSRNSEMGTAYRIDSAMNKYQSISSKFERTVYTGQSTSIAWSTSGGISRMWSNVKTFTQMVRKTKLTKLSKGVILLSGGLTAWDDFHNSEYNTQQERVVSAVTEGVYDVGAGVVSTKVGAVVGAATAEVVAMKIGATVGSAAGPLGIAVGAGVGFIAGIGVNQLIKYASNKKIVNDKSVIDITKDAVNSTINFAKDVAAPTIGKAIYNGMLSIGSNMVTGISGYGKAVSAW